MSTDHQTHGQPGLAVSQAPLGYNLQNIQALVSQNQQLQQSPSMNSVGSTHEGQQEPSQQQFCLRWNNFNSNIIKSFENLLYHEELVDVTLSAEGQYVKAHKVLLSACSQYFRDLFQSVPSHNHPIVFLRETRFEELKSLLCFIYHGEVNVAQENLPFLLNLAESLQVKGLAQERTCENMTFSQSSAGSRPSSCKIYPKERRDQSDPKNTKNKQRQTASPASPVNFSNLSALGTLLHTASAHKGHSGTPPTFNRPSPIHERNTPQHDIASPPHKSTQSPPSKRRKRTASPPNNSTHSNNMPSISPTEISSSPDRDESQAVNLSVAQAPQSPPPRLMVLKEELINKDEETPLQKDQRERLCNFFDKDSFAAGMMKLSGGNMDSEGEEEPPPPHEDENSGDIDSHGGSIPGLPLHHSLQQQFVPYPPSSLAGHHFPNFNPGTSVAHSGTGVPKWRSHSTEHTPSSPQDYNTVNKFSLYNNSPHQYMHWPSRRPAVCPSCGKFFKFKYNMKIHLKKCAGTHGTQNTSGNLAASSMALLGVVAAAANANIKDEKHHQSTNLNNSSPITHMHQTLRMTPPANPTHHNMPHLNHPPPSHAQQVHRVPHSSPVGRAIQHPSLPHVAVSNQSSVDILQNELHPLQGNRPPPCHREQLSPREQKHNPREQLHFMRDPSHFSREQPHGSREFAHVDQSMGSRENLPGPIEPPTSPRDPSNSNHHMVNHGQNPTS